MDRAHLPDLPKLNLSRGELDRLISGSMLRLRAHAPFFATLALYARFIPSEHTQTASTDGRDVFYNPDFLARLPPHQRDGLLLHEVLHAALLHLPRRGARDPMRWNVAADIVINGMIAKLDHFGLPSGGVRNEKWEKHTVEEVYELLDQKEVADFASKAGWHDLGEEAPDETPLEAYWKQALHQADVVQRAAGNAPSSLMREVEHLTHPQLDWRSALWRFVVKTPSDFQGFDRRHLGRGLYLEALESDSVDVFVCIDTSGSVGQTYLDLFVSELVGVLHAYPHISRQPCTLPMLDCTAPIPSTLISRCRRPRAVGVRASTSFSRL